MTLTPKICAECDFHWTEITRAEAVSGINDAVSEFVGIIEQAGDMAMVRTEPTKWSIVEYAGHLRDVLWSLRERIILTSIKDLPTGAPIYRDERVDLGFYSLDSTEDAADELAIAAGLISKTIAALPEGYDSREMIFNPTTEMKVSISWLALNALHECVHHLHDVK